MAPEVKFNNPKLAVAYARYSSDRQSDQSIDGQLRVINDYASKNGITLVEIYIDRALTGRSDDRPEFQRMIRDSKARGFGQVLVYKFDRFSRDRYDSLMYKRELKKNGVKVTSVTEYISEDPQGILLESLIDGYSEYYSAELAQKVRRGNRESRLKGQFTGGLCLFGYVIKDKKYVIEPDEAAIVKEIFDKVNHKVTYREICEDLNSRGITHKGSKFVPSYIGKVIQQEKYIGKCWIKGELYENIVPPLIDEETFNMAKYNTMQNMKRSSHYRSKNDFLLAGKTYCGYCGKLIYGETGSGKNNRVYTYYKCSSNKHKKNSCEKTTVTKEALEVQVIDVIKACILQSELIPQMATKLSEAYNEIIGDDTLLKANENAIMKNRKELDNVMKLVKRGIYSDTIQETLEQLEEQKKNLEIENIKLRSKGRMQLSQKECEDFLESLLKFDLSNESYRKIIIDKMVNKVITYNDKIEVALNPLDDSLVLDNIIKNGDGGLGVSSGQPSGPPYSQKPNP